MRRFGTIVMILGANLIVGAIAAGFWLAALNCALESDLRCTGGTIGQYFEVMLSGRGAGFWIVILAGIWVLWKGNCLRTRG